MPGVLPTFGSQTDEQFELANKLYEEGHYAEAADAYGRLIAGGQVSDAILFNRGNAFFKAGEIGKAIASYRQAQRLTPRDPDLRANLKFARARVNDKEAVVPLYLTCLRTLTINEWTVLAVVMSSIWFLLLTLTQWRPKLRAGTRWWKIITGFAAVLFLTAAGTRYFDEYSTPEAVVIAVDVKVRHGPLEESKPAFTAKDGAELKILDRKDEWLQVENNAGQIGWLTKKDVIELTPKS